MEYIILLSLDRLDKWQTALPQLVTFVRIHQTKVSFLRLTDCVFCTEINNISKFFGHKKL